MVGHVCPVQTPAGVFALRHPQRRQARCRDRGEAQGRGGAGRSARYVSGRAPEKRWDEARREIENYLSGVEVHG